VKIARYLGPDGPALGSVSGGTIDPLADGGGDTISLIERWTRDGHGGTRGEPVPLSSVRLLAPIERPRKILAIGLNYADHIAESQLETPSEQLWFCKQPTSASGPNDFIEMPAVSDKVELVAVIGRSGRSIPAERAHEHVFGYCVGNDVSVRDWQLATSQWMLGKSFDTHAPFGPWITTAHEIGDPHRLDISCHVNGVRKQASNTARLVFNLWDQIAHLSRAMTLEAGDLIFTGTPGGVGWAEQPKRTLSIGDVVRCEIEELGAIENVVQIGRTLS
jgi:2-keto-4-pentenoate hydratase/2-oxohepta-3-ene-1,7-dioic acid hydratase in catechol pathway